MDAAAFCARWDRRAVSEESVSDQQRADERRLLRTAKSCGPEAPTLASSSRSCVGPTGFRQNLALRMTVAKEPGHRGEHDISRKTIACGNAGRFRCTRCYSCAFYQYKVHTRPRVQRASGVPHALKGRKIHARLERIALRGREGAFSRHCEPTGRANARPMTGSAKQSILSFLVLYGLLRCARNDDLKALALGCLKVESGV